MTTRCSPEFYLLDPACIFLPNRCEPWDLCYTHIQAELLTHSPADPGRILTTPPSIGGKLPNFGDDSFQPLGPEALPIRSPQLGNCWYLSNDLLMDAAAATNCFGRLGRVLGPSGVLGMVDTTRWLFEIGNEMGK